MPRTAVVVIGFCLACLICLGGVFVLYDPRPVVQDILPWDDGRR